MQAALSFPQFPILRHLFSLALTFSLASASPAFGALNEGEDKTNGAVAENPAMAPMADVPGLPRVLLIGDSISIGYTVPVRELLKGKANVHRIPFNGGPSSQGRASLKQWLGEGKWDVIHFNFGLHDAKYGDGKKPNTSLDAYAANLQAILDALKPTGARVVWATTTPIPSDLLPVGRRFDPIENYNRTALEVMRKNGIAIDDLDAVIAPRQAELQHPHDVHFKAEGCRLLGKAVAESVLAQLPGK